MSKEERPGSASVSLCSLIRDLGAGVFDVRRIFSEPELLPSTLNVEAEEICRDREAARRALRDLLPGEHPPQGEAFYSRLEEFSVLLHNCPSQNMLLGIFLSESYHRWEAIGKRLLHDLNSHGHSAFFTALRGLPTFLAENELPKEFAVVWFVNVLDRLGNDMASGNFWDGLKTFARRFPRRALEITALLIRGRRPSDNALSIAATLLGVGRETATTRDAANELSVLEAEWRKSRRLRSRIYYQRSWIPTADERGLTSEEMHALLVDAEESVADEYADAFYVVVSCLQSEKTGAHAREVGLVWLRQQAVPTLPPLAKHHIVRFAAETGLAEYDDLLLAVQPVTTEHGGTWRLLIQILVQRLHDSGQAAFEHLLTSLASVGGLAFIKGISSSDASNRLVSALSNHDPSTLLADLLFSVQPVSRSLGLFFLEKLPTPAFSVEVLAGKTDAELLLSLLQLRGSALVIRGNVIAGYLLSIAPRVETAGIELQAEFEEELFVQAKNFPGACLKCFKSTADGSRLIKNAVAKAEAYFQALHTAQGSPLTAMHMPGMERAHQQHARRFAHAIHKGSEEKSIFAQIFKQVHLLYGDQFAFDQGGALEAQPFQHASVEMEVPRLEFVDPESMLLRRLTAKQEIARIERSLVEQPGSSQPGQTT